MLRRLAVDAGEVLGGAAEAAGQGVELGGSLGEL